MSQYGDFPWSARNLRLKQNSLVDVKNVVRPYGDHHGGGGRVGDPHGEEHSGQHEAQHQQPRARTLPG